MRASDGKLTPQASTNFLGGAAPRRAITLSHSIVTSPSGVSKVKVPCVHSFELLLYRGIIRPLSISAKIAASFASLARENSVPRFAI